MMRAHERRPPHRRDRDLPPLLGPSGVRSSGARRPDAWAATRARTVRPPPTASPLRGAAPPGRSPTSTGSGGRSPPTWACAGARRPRRSSPTAPMPGAAGSPAARSTTPSTPSPRPPTARDEVAVVARSQTRGRSAAHLGRAGRAGGPVPRPGSAGSVSGRGDRVAAYAPNIPETLVAFLATAVARRGVVELRAGVRHPIGPRPLRPDRAGRAPRRRRLPLRRQATSTGRPRSTPSVAALRRCATSSASATSAPAPTTGPACSAGPDPGPADVRGRARSTIRSTSSSPRAPPGCPRPIVHGHGGITVEHLKVLALHHDLGPGDRFCWFTTTGWMMWNYLVSGLLRGRRRRCSTAIPATPTWARSGTWPPRPAAPCSGRRRRS